MSADTCGPWPLGRVGGVSRTTQGSWHRLQAIAQSRSGMQRQASVCRRSRATAPRSRRWCSRTTQGSWRRLQTIARSGSGMHRQASVCRRLKARGYMVMSAVFSHDSRQLASGSHDCTVKIWDAETRKCLQTLEAHGGSVRSVVFLHDSRQLASASFDYTVKIWDAETENTG
jgi:WD40 repeat protein